MSLVHITATEATGYEFVTLYFDDREEDSLGDNPFVKFEKEFAPGEGGRGRHPEDTHIQTYYGYFIFRGVSADELYGLYRNRCEAKPNLKRRYNVYFGKEHVQLEDMIKKFDRPMEGDIGFKQKHKTYSHRFEYLARSVQILRDIQTAIYETTAEIAAKELELHKRFIRSSSDALE